MSSMTDESEMQHQTFHSVGQTEMALFIGREVGRLLRKWGEKILDLSTTPTFDFTKTSTHNLVSVKIIT